MVSKYCNKSQNDWSLSAQIYNFLDGITLGQLVKREFVQEVSMRQERQVASLRG